MFCHFFQLPCRTGPQTTYSKLNEEQNKKCLVTISKYRFSLVIAGLTKILQRVIDMIMNTSNGAIKPMGPDMERHCYESLVIVLETLEKCLTCESKDNTNFDENLNVKLLLPHICQIIGIRYQDNTLNSKY